MLMAAYLVALFLGGAFISGTPPVSPARLSPLLGLALAASGAVIHDRRYHAILAGILLAVLARGRLSTRSFGEPIPRRLRKGESLRAQPVAEVRGQKSFGARGDLAAQTRSITSPKGNEPPEG
jgi:hypothetical protein